jgi:hypothetical protein
MIVGSGEDNREAEERNRWSAMEMYHVLVKIIRVFDAQQTWINAGKISYGSNLVMAESDKGLNISDPPLMLMQQTDKLLTHFISGDLYKD